MADGYGLDFTATVNVRALTRNAKGFDDHQREVLGELKRFAARSNNVQFRVLLGGSLDAMNNFRKKYTRWAKNQVRVESQQVVLRLKGPRTPHWSGDTQESSQYRLDYNGSQRFSVYVSQSSTRRGFNYVGPVHDNAWNTRTGTRYWFLKATNAFQENVETAIAPSPVQLARLIR